MHTLFNSRQCAICLTVRDRGIFFCIFRRTVLKEKFSTSQGFPTIWNQPRMEGRSGPLHHLTPGEVRTPTTNLNADSQEKSAETSSGWVALPGVEARRRRQEVPERGAPQQVLRPERQPPKPPSHSGMGQGIKKGESPPPPVQKSAKCREKLLGLEKGQKSRSHALFF